MPFVTRKSLLSLSILSGIAVAAATGFVWSGIYNIGADDAHTKPVYAVLQALRERSIDARAQKLQLPANLNDPLRIRQGAGNYDAMCTGCHLGPGMQETELSKGLYPKPPNLAKAHVDAAEAFWAIKHGIKASGMPAWGKSMDDEYIWNMAAFLQQLPKLDAEQYQTLVASSGGHSHGGGETKPHSHAEGEADDHGAMEGMPIGDDSTPHAHSPGTPPHEDTSKPKPHAHPPGTPPHDDAPKPTATSTQSKPHMHPPGAPPHNHTAPVEPAATQPPSDKTPPEPASAGQDTHDHQH